MAFPRILYRYLSEIFTNSILSANVQDANKTTESNMMENNTANITKTIAKLIQDVITATNHTIRDETVKKEDYIASLRNWGIQDELQCGRIIVCGAVLFLFLLVLQLVLCRRVAAPERNYDEFYRLERGDFLVLSRSPMWLYKKKKTLAAPKRKISPKPQRPNFRTSFKFRQHKQFDQNGFRKRRGNKKSREVKSELQFDPNDVIAVSEPSSSPSASGDGNQDQQEVGHPSSSSTPELMVEEQVD